MLDWLTKVFRGPTRSRNERDTDTDWRALGEQEPYFGVLSQPQFLSQNLDDDALAEFFDSGVREIAGILDIADYQFGAFAPRSALDFGCGVGRLSRALSARIDDVVGVDISDGMLREARRAETEGLRFTSEIPDRHFDLIVSLIVFQHIPPARGYDLLAKLASALDTGGRIIVDLPVYRQAAVTITHTARIVEEDGRIRTVEQAPFDDSAAGTMMMYDYDISMVLGIFMNAGLSPFHLVRTDHGLHRCVRLFGVKQRAGS